MYLQRSMDTLIFYRALLRKARSKDWLGVNRLAELIPLYVQFLLISTSEIATFLG